MARASRRPTKRKGKGVRRRKPTPLPPIEEYLGAPPGETVLALDTSSSVVGWSYFKDGLLTEAGQYKQKGKKHGEKMHNFRAWLSTMFERFDPHQVVFEEPYPGRNRNAFRVLSMYVAILLAAHYAHFGREIPEPNVVPAHTVKRVLKMPRGDHDVQKKNAVLEVNRFYGLDLSIDDNDEADAIQLARAWVLINRPDLAGAVS